MSRCAPAPGSYLFPSHSRPVFPLSTLFNHQENVISPCGFQYLAISASPEHCSDRVRANECIFSMNASGWIVKSLHRVSDPLVRAGMEAASDH